MNNIICIRQMNTFFLIFWITSFRNISNDQNWGKIGALNTIALIFLTAVIGIYYARIQGIQTLRSGIINLYQNKVPIYELVSGASIAFAAILLIIPGFFTDYWFLLLFPFSRNFLFKIIIKKEEK